jgi:hypothetical protein
VTILEPTLPRDHPDRFSSCQLAIEDQMIDLLADAVKAGWTKDEVPAAMIELADDTARAVHENVLLTVETELRKRMKKRD